MAFVVCVNSLRYSVFQLHKRAQNTPTYIVRVYTFKQIDNQKVKENLNICKIFNVRTYMTYIGRSKRLNYRYNKNCSYLLT